MQLQSSYETLSTNLHDVTTKNSSILIGIVVKIWLPHNCGFNFVDAGTSVVSGAGLRSLDCRGRGFETRWRHGYCVLILLYVLHVAACVTGLLLVQGSSTGYVFVCVFLSLI